MVAFSSLPNTHLKLKNNLKYIFGYRCYTPSHKAKKTAQPIPSGNDEDQENADAEPAETTPTPTEELQENADTPDPIPTPAPPKMIAKDNCNRTMATGGHVMSLVLMLMYTPQTKHILRKAAFHDNR